jgi:5-methylcytosine-specific restriction endonuclease McrA
MTEEERAKKAEYQKRWYEKNKARHIANVAKRKAEVKLRASEYLRGLKESTPCVDCGKQYPYYVMDFDHLRDKEYQVSLMVGQGYDIPAIQKEIAKCEIVCSNCHRIRTFTREQRYGPVAQSSCANDS